MATYVPRRSTRPTGNVSVAGYWQNYSRMGGLRRTVGNEAG
jgi:hypothetical protein